MSSGAGVVSTPQKHESTFRKTITLLDWWLVKRQDGNKTRVSVSGITSQIQPVRVFSSAPIAKRFDVFTLETDDGVSVILKGVINTQKSIDNGFPTQVVKKFCLGFPENWQQCELETKLESPASDPLQNVKESPVPNKKRTHSKTSVARNNDDKSKELESPASVPLRNVKESPVPNKKRTRSKTSVARNNDDKSKELKSPASVPLQNVKKSPVPNKKRTRSKTSVGRNNVDKSKELESPSSDPLQNVKESPVPNKKRTRSKTSVAQNNDDKPKYVPQVDAKQKSTAGKRPKRISAGTVRQNNANTPHNKIEKKIICKEQATPRSQQVEKYVLSPEALSVGRSRSGRILLPTLEFWRNQVPVYEMDRTVSGIWEERSVPVPKRGSRSEPRKKRRQER